MKKAIFVFFLLAVATSIKAQTVTLGPITKLAYCVGDTMDVPYQASGTFAADNHFFVELSDASGSFSTFTNFGNDTAMSGSVAVKLSNTGLHYRVRIMATNPPVLSTDSSPYIQVFSYPSPSPTPVKGIGFYAHPYFVAGIIGDTIQIYDGAPESSGSKYLWKYGQDAMPNIISTSSAKVVYTTDGIKTLTLTVTNEAGCSATADFGYRILSCNPVIPHDVHVISGTETNSDSAVLVKAGGNYTTASKTYQTIFVESGGSLNISDGTLGLCYAENGASINSSKDELEGFETILLSRGTTINIPENSEIDTLYCNDLQFDYSQVNASVAQPEVSSITIRQFGDALFVEGEGNLDARVFNLLGNEIYSKRGTGTLDLDLSPLPAGVYFAIVQAGDAREVKRIAVVH